MILLDPRAGAHQGHGAASSFEWAVSAAASVVAHLAGLGYATHLICSETVHDGQAAMTTDPDHALDVLAEAETGPELELAELVRAAHPVTASGGLVVAILADRDEESLRQVASLRQPGGSGTGHRHRHRDVRRRVAERPRIPPTGAHPALSERPRAPSPTCSTPRVGRWRWPRRATASPRCGRL